jgi:hypothetical protein
MSRPAITFMQLEQWIRPVAQELSRRFSGWRNHYFGFERTDKQFVASNYDPQVLHFVWQALDTCVAQSSEQSFVNLSQCLKEQLMEHPAMAWRARSEAGASDWNPLEQSFDEFSMQFADTETYVAGSPQFAPFRPEEFNTFFDGCINHG